MLHSPVIWRQSALALFLLAGVLGCQGAIGSHPASTGQAGNVSVTGTAGAVGTGGTGLGTDPTGLGGGGGTVDPVVAACMASNGLLNAGLTPARRLTRDQYN